MSIGSVGSNAGGVPPVALTDPARERRAIAILDDFILVRDGAIRASREGGAPFAISVHAPQVRLRYSGGVLQVDGSALSPLPSLWYQGFVEEPIPLTVNLNDRYLIGAQKTLMILLNGLWEEMERAYFVLKAIHADQADYWASSEDRLDRVTALTEPLTASINRLNALAGSERQFLAKISNTSARREFDSLLHDIRSPFLGLWGNMELWVDSHIPAGRDIDLAILVPPTDLGSFFRKEKLFFQTDAAQRGVNLVVTFPPETVEWQFRNQTDLFLFTRIVNNFLGNAIKYSDDTKAPADRWVRLTVEVKGSELIVQVADSGIGMSRPFMRDHYGHYGQRAKEVVGTKIPGTGVGVYSALSRLRLLRGRFILAESELGRGSTVRFAVSLSRFVNLSQAVPASFKTQTPPASRMPVGLPATSPGPRSPLLGKLRELERERDGDKEARKQQELLYRLRASGHFVAAMEIEGLFTRGITTHLLHETGHHRASYSSHQDRLATLVNPAERSRALMLLGAASLGAIAAETSVAALCIVP